MVLLSTSSSIPWNALSSYLHFHHSCQVITTFVFPLTYTGFTFCLSFVFLWVHSAIMSFSYPLSIMNYFDINENYNPYFQQYPPLALMATPKPSPHLTTMRKDNLLYPCCTYFDIGFPIFLLSDNSPCHHLSPLLTELDYLIHVLSFNISFATGSWMIN